MELSDDGDLFQKICQYKKKGVYIDEKEIWSCQIQVYILDYQIFEMIKKINGQNQNIVSKNNFFTNIKHR